VSTDLADSTTVTALLHAVDAENERHTGFILDTHIIRLHNEHDVIIGKTGLRDFFTFI